MPTNHLHRQMLLEGLHQASGTVLWGKLRHVAPSHQEDPSITALGDSIKEGGRTRSRSRKARS